MFQWIDKLLIKHSTGRFAEELEFILNHVSIENKCLIRLQLSEFIWCAFKEVSRENLSLMYTVLNDPFACDYSQNILMFKKFTKIYHFCKQQAKDKISDSKCLDFDLSFFANEHEMLKIGMLFLLITVGLKFNPSLYSLTKKLWHEIEFSPEIIKSYMEKHKIEKELIYKHAREKYINFIPDFDDYPPEDILELSEYKPLCIKYDFQKRIRICAKNLLYIMNYSEKIFGMSKKEAIKMINIEFNSNIEHDSNNFIFPLDPNDMRISLFSLKNDRLDSITIHGGESEAGVSFVGSGNYWVANISDLTKPTSVAKRLYDIFWKLPGWETHGSGQYKYLKMKINHDL